MNNWIQNYVLKINISNYIITFTLYLTLFYKKIYLFYNRKVNDGNFGWRALRLLARKSPHFFAQSNNPIHKLSEYLENMIKKTMSKEKIVSSLFINYYTYINTYL